MSEALDVGKLAAARLWASARMPYLASALFASGVVVEDDLGTISVDAGWRLHVDPALVQQLEVEQLGRLVIHLTGHLIRDHAGRARALGIDQENGSPEQWNRCADAEINDDLSMLNAVPDQAPDQPADLGVEPRGLAERYYEKAPPGPRRWDCGSGADGCERPGDGGGIPAQQRELIRLGVAAEIQRSEQKLPGSVPGGWLRWAEHVLPSRVDWRKVLAAEIRAAITQVSGMVDYSYARPSRRTPPGADVIMPTLRRPVPNVAVVVDTSGSMHERLLERALAEVEGVLTRAGLRQQRIRVLAVDTAVHVVKRVSKASQVELGGGGGTDMGAGIEAAAELKPRPSVVIVLTDGFTPWPHRPPAGLKVIVGLLSQGYGSGNWRPPEWARTVVIEER